MVLSKKSACEHPFDAVFSWISFANHRAQVFEITQMVVGSRVGRYNTLATLCVPQQKVFSWETQCAEYLFQPETRKTRPSKVIPLGKLWKDSMRVAQSRVSRARCRDRFDSAFEHELSLLPADVDVKVGI